MRMTRLILFLLLLSLTATATRYNDGKNPRTSSPSSNRKNTKVYPSIMIMDRGTKTLDHLVNFLLENNSSLDSSYATCLVKTYILEARREGINHDVAICQMCLETGFLRFTGSVSRYQNNFCGLGAINAWSAGDWFRSMEEGVRAHIQHLKAYASIDSVTTPTVDPRFCRVRRGTVFTIYDLSGTWAADPDYGFKLDSLLKKLYQQ